MRVFKTMFAALLAALMLVSLPGCKKEKEFVVPSNMTREEAALFTAIANVCPKDDNHSKVEYLTFFIEGWSFDKLPPEITSYLTEYCANSGANLVQLSYEDLVAQGYITKGFTVTGTTVEELAAAMDVDSAALVETMDTWNANVASETDAEFEANLQAMIDLAKSYSDKNGNGYEQCVEWSKNEAATRKAAEDEAVALNK